MAVTARLKSAAYAETPVVSRCFFRLRWLPPKQQPRVFGWSLIESIRGSNQALKVVATNSNQNPFLLCRSADR
jgi:hypothetical protein